MARGKGEGSIYKRGDGLWCASVELPPGLDGKRRRKVVCRSSRHEALAAMAKFQKDAQQAAKEPPVLDALRAALRADRIGSWRGSSRRLP